MLAYYHQNNAAGWGWKGEAAKKASIIGITGLVLGGASRGVVTSNVWSTLAIGPVVFTEVEGIEPREELQYGAGIALRGLKEHYARVWDDLYALQSPADDQGANLDLACSNLTLEAGPVTSADAATIASVATTKAKGLALEALQTDVKNAAAYCQSFSDAEQSYAVFSSDITASLQRLPLQYAHDAHLLEGVFRKVDRGFDLTPAQSITTILAAPFQTIASANRRGGSTPNISDPQVSFDLEKDGLPLSNPLVPGLTAPDKAFPVTVLADDPALHANLQAAFGGSPPTGLEATMGLIQTISVKAQAQNRKMNHAGAKLAWVATQYKMTFDFRTSKSTAEVVVDNGNSPASAPAVTPAPATPPSASTAKAKT